MGIRHRCHAFVHETALLALRDNLGPEEFASQIDTAIERINALRALLTASEVKENPDLPALGDAVHDLVGISGLLGLTAFSAGLRRFDTARTRDVTALEEMAAAATSALRRFQSMGNGLTPSQVYWKPPVAR